MLTLPIPCNAALKLSSELFEYIRDDLFDRGGLISFARFMDLVLYTPDLGYYCAGREKLGRTGDFMTAPEYSPIFARSVARQCQQILEMFVGSDMLELGAGSGKFAYSMLLELDDLDSLPEIYYILEISANLRERQRVLLSTLPEEIYARVKWIDDFPEKPFDGVIIGNEFLDALPVNCFQILNDDVAERCVKFENKKFAWQAVPATNKDLIRHVNRVREKYPLSEGYKSEVNLALPQWIKRMSAALKSGIILLLDYGYPRHEYFRPERVRGTMMCHYQHRRHEDPYQLYGLQDITAHVDFTTIAEIAVDADLKVAGYTNQASFLLACGIMDLAEKNELPPREEYQQNHAIKILTLPAEMGETIKVIALTRDIPCMLTGYQVEDRRKTL